MTTVDGLTAAGLTPLLARTVNVNGPTVVGVPDNTPLVEFRANPGGNAPLASAYVGVGLPEAV